MLPCFDVRRVVNSTTQSPAGHQAPQPLQLQMHSLIDVSTKRPMLQNRRPLSCGTAARPFLHKLQKLPLLIDNLQHSLISPVTCGYCQKLPNLLVPNVS
jgi:hypothetical protein